MISTYKELKFWQSSREVSILVVKLIRLLPKEKIAWIITDQVLRSSFSIGANIAEGFGKYKGKEYQRFISMALGSANETEYWLELLVEFFPGHKVEIDKILSKNIETIKMLTSTLKTLKSKI